MSELTSEELHAWQISVQSTAHGQIEANEETLEYLASEWTDTLAELESMPEPEIAPSLSYSDPENMTEEELVAERERIEAYLEVEQRRMSLRETLLKNHQSQRQSLLYAVALFGMTLVPQTRQEVIMQSLTSALLMRSETTKAGFEDILATIEKVAEKIESVSSTLREMQHHLSSIDRYIQLMSSDLQDISLQSS